MKSGLAAADGVALAHEVLADLKVASVDLEFVGESEESLPKLKRVSILHNAPVDGDGDGGLLAIVGEHRAASAANKVAC